MLLSRIKFWRNADRIGPDIPWTSWKLHFPKLGFNLAKDKFKEFGSGSQLRWGCYIVGCSQIEIGARVIIRPGTMLHGETDTLDCSIIIEDDVLIGSGVHIYVENHRYSHANELIINQGHEQAKQVRIKNGCWIGANVIILPGVTIGDHSVVGAGSVVTRSIPSRVVVAGCPARIVKTIK